MPSTHTTVNSSAHAIAAPSRVDPEVLEKPERRQFSAAYKLQILQESDSCQAGQVGAILRREGLYSSHLTCWRRQRQQGQMAALTEHKRGRRPEPVNPLAAEVMRIGKKLENHIGAIWLFIHDYNRRIREKLAEQGNPILSSVLY